MGDILGAIFGTSGAQEQTTTPDPMQQMLNAERLNQVLTLFRNMGPIGQFAAPQPEAYAPTPQTQAITSLVGRMLPDIAQAGNVYIPTIQDYLSSFDRTTNTYNDALYQNDAISTQNVAGNAQDYATGINQTRQNVNNALGRSYGDFGIGTTGAGQTYNTALTDSADIADRTRLQNEINYLRSIGLTDQDAARAVLTQEAARSRALGTGTSAISDYITRIAEPAINRNLALQGLERGGAPAQAIATATAEQVVPYLQAIEQAYGANVAQALATALQAKAGLSNQLMGLQSQVGGQQLAAQSEAASNYQNNINQLAQTLLNNNVTLEQAGIAADSALGQQLLQAQNAVRLQRQQTAGQLGNTFLPLSAAFAQSIPGATQTLSLLPTTLQTARTANLTALAPLADFERQLREQDLLRRQGIFQTVYTGIPFQPGSTVNQASETGNLFNNLGSFMVSGFTGGTKGGVNGA